MEDFLDENLSDLLEDEPEDYIVALLRTSSFLTSLQEEGLSPVVALTAAMTHMFRHVSSLSVDNTSAKALVDACFFNATAINETEGDTTIRVMHEGNKKIH